LKRRVIGCEPRFCLMPPALLIAIALFSLLGHGYLWIGIVNRLHAWAGPHRLIDNLTHAALLSFLILPLLVAWAWWTNGTAFFTRQYLPLPTDLARMYVISTAFFGFGKLLAKCIGGWSLDDPAAVVWKERQSITALTADEYLATRYAKLLGCVPGNQVLQIAIDSKRLAIPRLPKALAGFRIVHVSDWHMTGRVSANWFRQVAEVVNAIEADAIMITGDLIENEACRPWLKDSFGQLQAKQGVYFVLGNHDYYVDAQRTITELEKFGLVYTGGKELTANWNGAKVSLLGNEAPWSLAPPTPEVSPVAPEHDFRIALVHTPDQFEWALQHRAYLVLAGHTHGGQVCFPILGAVAAPSLYGTRFAGGTFRRGDTVMHVTRGISGETPMRWLCPPEIAVLELTPAVR
jgi:uncharacterized protein